MKVDFDFKGIHFLSICFYIEWERSEGVAGAEFPFSLPI